MIQLLRQPILPSMQDKVAETDTRKALLDIVQGVNTAIASLNTIYDVSATSSEYLAYPDGLMVVWGTVASAAVATLHAGVYWWAADQVVVFPVAFTSRPAVSVSGDNYAFGSIIAAPTVTGFSFNVSRANNSGSAAGYWQAIGKWR